MAQSQGGWRRLVLHQWGSKRKWCYLRSFVYTRAASCSACTRSNQDSVYTRSLDDSVYTRWCSFTHTSVRGAASAWAADTRLSSDCDCVCVTAFVRRVSWAMTRVGAGDLRQQLLVGRLLSRPVCLGVGRAAAADTQLQASLL